MLTNTCKLENEHLMLAVLSFPYNQHLPCAVNQLLRMRFKYDEIDNGT